MVWREGGGSQREETRATFRFLMETCSGSFSLMLFFKHLQGGDSCATWGTVQRQSRSSSQSFQLQPMRQINPKSTENAKRVYVDATQPRVTQRGATAEAVRRRGTAAPTSVFAFFIFETRSRSVAQAGLNFTILLPQPPKGWDYRCVPPGPAYFSSFT
jgi:hypothetical protein